jgi:protein-glutamine gamma-glutamyltransferase
MALALRQRGIPARIISGYRLGAWVDVGGYWIITQDDAHSWVEYLDEEEGMWCVSDPTPALPPGKYGENTLMASLYRQMDAIRFKWENLVMRFSLHNQLAGLAWIQSKFSFLAINKSHLKYLLITILACFSLSSLFLVMRKRRSKTAWILPDLIPLIRATRNEFPVQPGDTIQSWCIRVSQVKPGMQGKLALLATLSDRAAYGNGDSKPLKQLVLELKRLYHQPT